MSVLTLEAKLERTESSTPWGFRMQGGKDFSSPLTIQRVNPGSLAAKCGLQIGDIILKIGNTTTDTLRHKEAQTSILQCGNGLDLLLQRGGSGGYDKFNAPQVNAWSSAPAPQVNNAPGPAPSSQNFNPSPRPFGSQAPSRSYEAGLSQQAQNLNISSQPREPPKEPPSFQDAAEKYSDRDEPADPSQHQSRSFKYLQNLMDEGKELNNALKPDRKPAPFTPSNTSYNNSNPSSSVAPPARGPSPTPVGPGSKPGTVKAIVSQRYNNPIGLYSNDNVSTQFQGQTKFLLEKDGPEEPLPPPPPPENDGGKDSTGKKKYVPSETFRLVQEQSGLLQKDGESGPAHSRTFKMLQQQLGSGGAASPPAPSPSGYKPVASPTTFQPAPSAPSFPPATAAKPWAPPPPAPSAPVPVANTTPRPFGVAPPKPSGVGATRGKKGDAAMNSAPLPSGRIPVCSGCNMPIRGPFVTALGKCWCPDHFVCAHAQCGNKLLDIGFVEEGGFLYCEKDYAENFAPHCEKCGRAIIGECVNAVQKSYHKECFLCNHCNKPIGGNQFHIEDGKFFCENDWNSLFQTMCASCEFPIEPQDSWVEAMGKNFHSECFNCTKCQVNLEGQQFVAISGKPYCKNHAK